MRLQLRLHARFDPTAEKGQFAFALVKSPYTRFRGRGQAV
jgi:hypothetical protein